MIIKKGQIYLTSLDPTVGSEINKVRPAVVVSNNISNTYADTITIVPITSNIEKLYSFEVLLEAGEGNLLKTSKVRADQIRTVDKKRLVKYMRYLTESKLAQVEDAIKVHLGLK